MIAKENADLNGLGYRREYRLVPRQLQQAAQDGARAQGVFNGEKGSSPVEKEAAVASQAESDPKAKTVVAIGKLRSHFSPHKLSQAEITQALRTLVGTLRQLFDVEGNGNPSLPNSSGGKDGYVDKSKNHRNEQAFGKGIWRAHR